jgi:hypothetical protein
MAQPTSQAATGRQPAGLLGAALFTAVLTLQRWRTCLRQPQVESAKESGGSVQPPRWRPSRPNRR